MKEVAFLKSRLLSSQSEQFKKLLKSNDRLEKCSTPKTPFVLTAS